MEKKKNEKWKKKNRAEKRYEQDGWYVDDTCVPYFNVLSSILYMNRLA